MSWGASCIGRSTTGCNVTSYPTAGWTNDLVLGPDGNIYFSDKGRKLGRATPSATITEFPTTYGTNDPVVGPGNTIWFGELGPKVGRLSIASDQITEWTVKAGSLSGSLLVTPDGSIWFGTDLVIGRVTPQGQVQEYDIGGAGAFNLLHGPDGNVWFGCQFAAQIGKVTSGGQVSLYNVSGYPMGLCFGSDNKLYVGQTTYFLAVVDLQGKVTERPLTGAIPYAPHLGPDGNVWFSGNPYLSPGVSAFVGRIKPNGSLTEFQQSAHPNSFLNGRDGRTMYMGMNTAAFGVVTLT
jgi:virginiamycin B lyase